MNDGQETDNVNELPFYGDHRFLALIVGSIIITILLLVVSISLYYTSDAAQLDLSRPGYKDVRSQAVSKDDSFSNFSSSGAINQTIINDFKTLFEKQAIKAKAIDAFGGDPLNPETLWVND